MSLFLMTRCKALYFISWLLLVSAGLALPALAQTSSYSETQLIQRAEQSLSLIHI